ncbi:hypothetical protein MKW94_018011 [Papaver nudicaule]|uniref:Major facilitator superfamily (MFS) profile domain-containing protein n=1 Tax=Papaver nudicaule TaxID=74823 RepID=A0AA41VFJ5_PAPNU|nr:hypothetical protein [Papaver nudicaule]
MNITLLKKRLLVTVYALLAGIPALVFGYYLAVICATAYAPEEVKRSPWKYAWELEINWMTFLGCGAVVGSIISLQDNFQDSGSNLSSISTSLLFILYVPVVFWMCLPHYSPDDNVPGQFPALMLVGCAGASSLIFLLIYISEISPSTIRGALVSTVFLQIAGGQIIYHLLNLLSSSTAQEIQTWHWMLAVGLPIIHVTVAACVLPDSPRWLYRKGLIRQAEESLKKIRSSCEVSKEVKAMELSLAEEAAERQLKDKKLKFPNRFTVIWYKVPSKRIIVGFGSIVAQQLVGINMIMHYSYTILSLTTNRYSTGKTENGNAENMNMVASSEIPLITSSLVLVGTLICTALVDRYGRRRLLLVSICGIMSSLGLLSYLFYIGSETDAGNENRAFWYDIGEERASGMGLLAVTALTMYIIFYSLGIGTIPWIINSEIFPVTYRSACLVFASMVYWCSKMIVQDFLLDSLGCRLSIAGMLFVLCLFSAAVGFFSTCTFQRQKGCNLKRSRKY